MEQGTAFLEALMREFGESEVRRKNDVATFDACLEQQRESHNNELQAAREQVSAELDEIREANAMLEGKIKSLTEDLSKARCQIEDLKAKPNNTAKPQLCVSQAAIGARSEQANASSESPDFPKFFTPQDKPIAIPGSKTFGRGDEYTVLDPNQSSGSPSGASDVRLPQGSVRDAVTKRKRPVTHDELYYTHSSRRVYKGPKLLDQAHLRRKSNVKGGGRAFSDVAADEQSNSNHTVQSKADLETWHLPKRPSKARKAVVSRGSTLTEVSETQSTSQNHHDDDAETLKIAEMAVAASKARMAKPSLPPTAGGYNSPKVVIDTLVTNGHTLHSDNIVVGHRKQVTFSEDSMDHSGVQDSLDTTTTVHDDESDQDTPDPHALLMQQFKARKGDKQPLTQSSEQREDDTTEIPDEMHVRPVRQRVKNKRYAGDYVLDVKEFDRRCKG